MILAIIDWNRVGFSRQLTRAYKRTQNSIYSSKIASPFKKRNLTPPPTIPRTAPPGVHSRPILISRLLRMRINEIKRIFDGWTSALILLKRNIYSLCGAGVRYTCMSCKLHYVHSECGLFTFFRWLQAAMPLARNKKLLLLHTEDFSNRFWYS